MSLDIEIEGIPSYPNLFIEFQIANSKSFHQREGFVQFLQVFCPRFLSVREFSLTLPENGFCFPISDNSLTGYNIKL